MASEKQKLYSKLELEVFGAAGTCTVLTDVPGDAIAQRSSFAVPVSSTRRRVSSRLPYNTTGHLLQVIFVPTGTGKTAIFRARVWARELPGGQWQWYPVPVIDTPVEFSPSALPIPPTSEEWRERELPIPVTAEQWRENALPIAVTPEEWKGVALSIPATPEEWSTMKLPVKPTPDVPDWADLEIDK